MPAASSSQPPSGLTIPPVARGQKMSSLPNPRKSPSPGVEVSPERAERAERDGSRDGSRLRPPSQSDNAAAIQPQPKKHPSRKSIPRSHTTSSGSLLPMAAADDDAIDPELVKVISIPPRPRALPHPCAVWAHRCGYTAGSAQPLSRRLPCDPATQQTGLRPPRFWTNCRLAMPAAPAAATHAPHRPQRLPARVPAAPVWPPLWVGVRLWWEAMPGISFWVRIRAAPPSCSHPQVIHPNQPGQAFQNGECAGADEPERQRPSSAPVEGERKILGTFFPLFFLVFQLHSFPTTGIPPGLAWPARLTCPRLLLPQSQRHATC